MDANCETPMMTTTHKAANKSIIQVETKSPDTSSQPMTTKKRNCGCCGEHGHFKPNCPNIERVRKEKEEKKVKKRGKSSHIMSRVTTMAYEMMRDRVNHTLDTKQPEFTPKDKTMKGEIFGFDGKTSFISGMKCKGVGDHIYGVREGFAAGCDWVGSNSKWNTVPVTHKENVSYKKVVIGGVRKNLAFDIFSTEERATFNEEQEMIYTKIKKWEKYVCSRGAHMYWENQREYDDKYVAKAHEVCSELLALVLNDV
jgi:hypothetical protein